MHRFQASWLAEVILTNNTGLDGDFNWFFPWAGEFSPLDWIGQQNIKVTINYPVYCLALLARSWFLKTYAFIDDDLLPFFNQIQMKGIDSKLNPFKAWKDFYFNNEQLDYLFFWRESANEIKNPYAKEAFFAIIFQIMKYWLSNNEYTEMLYTPEEMFSVFYGRYKSFRDNLTNFVVLENQVDILSSIDCSTVVYNLIIKDDENFLEETLLLYNSWIVGHSDLDASRLLISKAYEGIVLELGGDFDFSIFQKLAFNAKSAAFCWSSKGISPNYYAMFLVTPILDAMSFKYKKSKFVYKCIDASTEEFDFILLCF